MQPLKGMCLISMMVLSVGHDERDMKVVQTL